MSSFSRTSCYFSLAIHHIVFNVHVIILLYAFIFVLVNNYVTMYPLHYRSLSRSLCVFFYGYSCDDASATGCHAISWRSKSIRWAVITNIRPTIHFHAAAAAATAVRDVTKPWSQVYDRIMTRARGSTSFLRFHDDLELIPCRGRTRILSRSPEYRVEYVSGDSPISNVLNDYTWNSPPASLLVGGVALLPSTMMTCSRDCNRRQLISHRCDMTAATSDGPPPSLYVTSNARRQTAEYRMG